jgi:hypothetical protein
MKTIGIHPHAQERIRQRFGITSLKAMKSWARAKLLDGKYVKTQADGRKVYHWGNVELIVTGDEKLLITVMDLTTPKSYSEKFSEAIAKEAHKALVGKGRAFRKAEIVVAEITLNMLKCRNPKIKAKLNENLTKANDEKEAILSEIKAIKRSAREYGVEV